MFNLTGFGKKYGTGMVAFKSKDGHRAGPPWVLSVVVEEGAIRQTSSIELNLYDARLLLRDLKEVIENED